MNGENVSAQCIGGSFRPDEADEMFETSREENHHNVHPDISPSQFPREFTTRLRAGDLSSETQTNSENTDDIRTKTNDKSPNPTGKLINSVAETPQPPHVALIGEENLAPSLRTVAHENPDEQQIPHGFQPSKKRDLNTMLQRAGYCDRPPFVALSNLVPTNATCIQPHLWVAHNADPSSVFIYNAVSKDHKTLIREIPYRHEAIIISHRMDVITSLTAIRERLADVRTR